MMSATCAKPSRAAAGGAAAFGEKPASGSSPVTAPSASRRVPPRAERERAVGAPSARARSRCAGCSSSAGDQRGMALLDLLEREPVRALHQVDEPEVARAEDDDVAVRRDLGALVLAPCRRGRSPRRARAPIAVAFSSPASTPSTSPPDSERSTSSSSAVAVALPERRALGLAVVGEHDDLVGPRRVAARALDHPEALVELAQRLERVGALEARVVGDLVVAGERRVDRGHAAEHVLQDREHDEVAHEDAHPGAQQRIDAAAVAARAHVAPALARRGDQLEHDLPEHEHERAGDVRAVGEERAVAGVGALLVGDAAGGEERRVGLAGQQVAAARPAVRRAARRRRARALDRRAVVRVRAGDHPARRLVDPAERRDVVVVARAGSRPGWRRSATTGRSPTRRSRWVPSASQRAMFGVVPSRIARRSTGSASPSISRNRIPGASVTVGRSRAARDAPGDAERVRVVVVDARRRRRSAC